jgi:hypothetical protein
VTNIRWERLIENAPMICQGIGTRVSFVGIGFSSAQFSAVPPRNCMVYCLFSRFYVYHRFNPTAKNNEAEGVAGNWAVEDPISASW